MRKSILDLLSCPKCKKKTLILKIFQQKANYIEQGILYCSLCGEIFPIIDEIPVLMPSYKISKLSLKEKEIIRKFVKNHTSETEKVVDYLKLFSEFDFSLNISKQEISEIEFWEKKYIEGNLAKSDRLKEEKGGDRLYPRGKYISSFLRKFVKEKGSVLEIGCGIPTIVRTMLSSDKNDIYIGTDMSFNVLQYAQKMNPLGNFIQCDVEALPFNKGSFDIILSLGVLHHTSNLEDNIPCLFKLLKPGGYLTIHEPMRLGRNSLPWVASIIKRFFSSKDISPMENKLEKPKVLSLIRKNAKIILFKEEYSPVRWILVNVFKNYMAKNLLLTKLIILIDDIVISFSKFIDFKFLRGAGAIIVSQKFKR